MKAVIDTNVFIGALQARDGINRAVLADCFAGDIDPLMGDALYYEYESLLYRHYLFEKCRLDEKEREGFLNSFLSICKWVRVHYLWRPNLRDEADNHIVELAMAGGADMIVTWNRKDFHGGSLAIRHLAIVTPHEYRKEREQKKWRL